MAGWLIVGIPDKGKHRTKLSPYRAWSDQGFQGRGDPRHRWRDSGI